jgi:hypothetical protein
METVTLCCIHRYECWCTTSDILINWRIPARRPTWLAAVRRLSVCQSVCGLLVSPAGWFAQVATVVTWPTVMSTKILFSSELLRLSASPALSRSFIHPSAHSVHPFIIFSRVVCYISVHVMWRTLISLHHCSKNTLHVYIDDLPDVFWL